MIDRERLLSDLKTELPKIEADILQYSERQAELGQHLRGEYDKAVQAGRTAEHFVAWREAQITQAAAAWVLTCVFVRFLEDNGLLDEPVLSGPAAREDGGSPLAHAKERITHHFNEHPAHGEREYLLALFRELDQFPVIDALLDRQHNPLWQIRVSDDGAKRLVDFFQRIDPETAELIHDFTDPEWDTRFLGDLYQDLSEAVRDKYALFQTPEFVEEFILDYSLTPAIETFGLEGLRLIDPTCGSGHFLLTTFERLFDAWQRREPATNARHLVQRVLDVVHGVDINPYAIAVAKFRLLIAALKAAGSDKIRNAPDFDFHLAVGDSLLHGKRHESQGQGLQMDGLDDMFIHAFETEKIGELNRILGQRYHVVVGNPPYPTVKDKALNSAYRDRYLSCHMRYSLSAPFAERFFDLAIGGDLSPGYVGMIIADSFMKREFGRKLVEEYFIRKDITSIVQASGAYIPGHGTPTIIIFGRNRVPQNNQLKVVLNLKGEPVIPEDPAKGLVWSSIVKYFSKGAGGNDYVSVKPWGRASLSKHPWILKDVDAVDLLGKMKEDKASLKDIAAQIGIGSVAGCDDVLIFRDKKIPRRFGVSKTHPFVVGDGVRDWGVSPQVILNMYDRDWAPLGFSKIGRMSRFLWRYKNILNKRKRFGTPLVERGLPWYGFQELYTEKLKDYRSIVFSFVSTHNNFSYDEEGCIFKQTAPILKFSLSDGESIFFNVLGVLNSSLVCFWLRSTCSKKEDRGENWSVRYEFDSTKVGRVPIPSVDEYFGGIAKKIDALSKDSENFESDVLKKISSVTDVVAEKQNSLNKAISLQEELDWHCYRLYGVLDEDLCYQGSPPAVKLGERAFEIALARRMAVGETETVWFERHGSTPITEIPDHWPADYRELVKRRLKVIEENRWVKLVEKPEYKRRWNREPWEKRQQRALKEWLLDRLEEEVKANGPVLITGAQLADGVRHDEKFQQVAELYTHNQLFDAQQLVTELIAIDEVPQMAPARLKPVAIKKFRAWQETWGKQRQEDAIDAEFGVAEPLSPGDVENAEKVKAYEAAKKKAEAKKATKVGTMPVPPKYAATDFRKGSYWSLRGKLDVPKERFFSLAGCEKPGDDTPVIGWAGLDHLQRAQAIAGWYMVRKEQDGWEPDKLMPMLVALEELIPWLKQWHNDLNPEFGERIGEFYEGFLFEELRQLELTREDLLAWQPPAARRSRRRKTATSA